jgi:pseudomonalisin
VKRHLLLLATCIAVAGCSSHSSAVPPRSNDAQSSDLQSSAVALTGQAAAPLGWAATHTLAFGIKGATDLGAVAATTPITIRLGLQLRNLNALKTAVADGITVSTASFIGEYAPTSTQVSAVRTFLTQKGFTNITIEPNDVLISATAPASTVEKAFDTTLHTLALNGKTFHANVSPAFVPQTLANIVVAVLGLNNAPVVHTGPKVTPCTGGVTTPCARFYDPITFRTAYDATDTDGDQSNSPGGDSDDTAWNTTIGIMAEGNVTQAISDFRYNESKFGLPQAQLIIKPVGLMSTDTAGNDEWTLDMTYSTGMSGRVKTLYLYDTTSLTDSDIALEYSHWVTDDVARIGNSSFGECELFPYLDGAMLVDDMLFLEGASHGQTMFASTGDTGGFCSVGVPPNGVPGGAPFVEYPAASPYVTAVGGTDLFTNANGSYKGETAWEAGGGGYSQFEYSPYWEAYAQPLAAEGQSLRGTPDVAMDASLETGAYLYLGGVEYITGGTSLASPLAAGSYAIMQTQHSNSLGFAPPRFYKIYKLHPASSATLLGPPPTEVVGGFHDIIVGSNANPACTAIPRWDCTTGLGSIDVLKTNALIGAATPP